MARPIPPVKVDALRQQVQELLDKQCLKRHVDFRLEIEAKVEQEGWVHLVVVPDKKDIRIYDYASILSEVEDVLRRTNIK